MRPNCLAIVIVALLSGICCIARAHNPGLSVLKIDQTTEGASVVLQFPPPDLDGDGQASPDELAAAEVFLRKHVDRWLNLRNDSGSIPLEPGTLSTSEKSQAVFWRTVTSTKPTGTWQVRLAGLKNLPAGHRELVTVMSEEGSLVAEHLLSRHDDHLEITWPETNLATPAGDQEIRTHASTTPGFLGFLRLGIEHILTGYDHLLYLAGMIVVCRRLKDVLVIVTSFTVAHSITLAAATIGAIDAPPSIVEPMIAGSIVFVGIENLIFGGRQPGTRWIIAFVFGLVHGLGFAGILRNLGLGANGMPLAVPLFSFNLGVELGQMGVVAVALPFLLRARKIDTFERLALPALSGLVALMGGWWLIERVWL